MTETNPNQIPQPKWIQAPGRVVRFVTPHNLWAGGLANPGESFHVSHEEADALIRAGKAHSPDQPPPAPQGTAPVSDTPLTRVRFVAKWTFPWHPYRQYNANDCHGLAGAEVDAALASGCAVLDAGDVNDTPKDRERLHATLQQITERRAARRIGQ